MTPQAFDKLLNALSKDREEAGREYERVRTKLIRYFQWRGVRRSDEYVDETFNRVARRIDEGKVIDDLMAFTFGVARIICKEVLRREDPVPLDDTPEGDYAPAPPAVEPDDREECFDLCMEKRSAENRDLILEYYREDGGAKIQLRQQLAQRLGIGLNALRIRAHRIRMDLERCIKECLEIRQVRNE